MDRPFRMPKARFATYLLIASLAPTLLAATIGLGIWSTWDRFRTEERQIGRLLDQGNHAAAMIRDLPLELADPAVKRLLKNFALIDEIRITVILPDGTVLADTITDKPAELENHLERPEVKTALAGKIGTSVRKSATTGIEYLYAAQPYRQKEKIAAVVRVAKSASLIRSERNALFNRMASIGGIYALLAAAVSLTISGIFGRFVRRMSDIAERMADGRFDLKMRRMHIEELDILGSTLNRMAEGVERSMRDLVLEKNELESVRDELKKTVALKESYLKELQHRVKNNLNVISSMLNLEIGRLQEPAARQAFKEMAARVDTVSRIYETLYKSADLETVDLKPYLEGLAATIHRAYVKDLDGGGLEIDIAPVRIDSKRALPLGLILNECLSNAFKYAFPPPREGAVRIRVEDSPAELIFSVSDDGVGFPQGFAPEKSDTLGLQLIVMLARQLGAKLSIDGMQGVTIELKIPK